MCSEADLHPLMSESVGRGAPYVRTTRNWLNTSWICLRLIIWREENKGGGD